MTRPFRVGLTGGIGSGKTTVCEFFRELGVPIIDADEIARELVARGKPALQAIIDEFGPQIAGQSGQLDREALRRVVFSNPQKRKRLEAILHPRVYREMDQRVSTVVAPYCILCIPLLIETGGQRCVDHILVVDLPEDVQRQRVMTRDGLDAPEVDAIMQSQASRAQRLAEADSVLVNDGDKAQLKRQVGKLHLRYLDLAGGADHS